MKGIMRAASAAMLIGMAAPAPLAAQETASRIPREGTTTVGPERLVLQRFARCFVTDYPDRAAEIALSPSAPLFARSGGELGRCLSLVGGGEMRPAPIVLIGLFAEQLYVRRFPILPPLAAAEPPSQSPTGPIAATLVFADCLIDRDPQLVDALVRTHAASEEEEGAFTRLSGHYGPCLDMGSTMQLNHLALRTALAARLFRRAVAGASAAQAQHPRQS